jgi:hypothetical protein
VDLGRIELPTSSLQTRRYNQLSHRPYLFKLNFQQKNRSFHFGSKSTKKLLLRSATVSFLFFTHLSFFFDLGRKKPFLFSCHVLYFTYPLWSTPSLFQLPDQLFPHIIMLSFVPQGPKPHSPQLTFFHQPIFGRQRLQILVINLFSHSFVLIDHPRTHRQ